MKKPIIGITLDNEEPGSYSNYPWYAIRYNYLHSIEKFGAIPFPLYHTQKNIDELFNILDGIIITGGNFDLDPTLYGEKNVDSKKLKNNRTNFEILICKKFLSSSKPMLGICGGEQLLNVVCGGTLIQDIKKNCKNVLEHEQSNPRNETSHDVKINKHTLIHKIVKKNILKVNSAHHQAVKKIGKDLIISGCSNDGIIESIEHTNHRWCIGVQWHPEFLITNEDSCLIKNFVESSIV
tara:strand:+ start:7307 stop:8017 length:711 start_codon:yes stop_codon:yes gene_type:complete